MQTLDAEIGRRVTERHRCVLKADDDTITIIVRQALDAIVVYRVADLTRLATNVVTLDSWGLTGGGRGLFGGGGRAWVLGRGGGGYAFAVLACLGVETDDSGADAFVALRVAGGIANVLARLGIIAFPAGVCFLVAEQRLAALDSLTGSAWRYDTDADVADVLADAEAADTTSAVVIIVVVIAVRKEAGCLR